MKRKFINGYRVLYLVVVVVICVMLTGAGRGYATLGEKLDNPFEKSQQDVLISQNEISLESLIYEHYVLRINYDLKDKNKENLGIIKGYTGDDELLGNKLDKQIVFVVSNVKDQEWFPILRFDAYEWVDEEKDLGIISLVLTQESKLAFVQIQDTTLYEQLPNYAIKRLKYRDSSSVQNITIHTNYSLRNPIEGLKCSVELIEQIKMLRNIEVIIPELI